VDLGYVIHDRVDSLASGPQLVVHPVQELLPVVVIVQDIVAQPVHACFENVEDPFGVYQVEIVLASSRPVSRLRVRPFQEDIVVSVEHLLLIRLHAGSGVPVASFLHAAVALDGFFQ